MMPMTAPRLTFARVSSLFSLLALVALVASACGGDDDHDDDSGGVDAGTPDGGTGTIDAATECSTPLPPPAMCDFFLGCGCDTPSEKCSYTGTMRACTSAGAKAVGETCTNDTECVAASLCASPVVGGPKRCIAFCDPSHPCGQSDACYITVAGLADAKLCGQSCDLRGQDCEFAEQGCYPSKENQPAMEKGVCAAAGDGTAGADCTAANDCAEGYTCIMDDKKCHALCDRGGGLPMCASGTCSALKDHTATGYCK
jgi:hypothetical protein